MSPPNEKTRDKEKKEIDTHRDMRIDTEKQINRDVRKYKATFLKNPSTWPVCLPWEMIAGSAQQGAAE